MIRLLFLIGTITLSASVFGQSESDRMDSDYLSYKRSFFGYNFFNQEREISKDEVIGYLEIDEEALKLFNNSMTKTYVSNIVGFVGGFLLGWNIGSYITSGTYNGSTTAVGLGLTVFSLGLDSQVHSGLRKALNIYNEIYSIVPAKGNSGKLVIGGNSIGLLYTF